jgi:hypothetical protein
MKYCDKSIFKRRSINAIQIHFFREHDHLKNSSFIKHDRFNIHNEEITKKIHTLYDEIENESQFKLYFNCYVTTCKKHESIYREKAFRLISFFVAARDMTTSSSRACRLLLTSYNSQSSMIIILRLFFFRIHLCT